MKFDRKAEIGWETIVMWAVIIGIGVALMVIMVKSTDVGKSAFASIKDTFTFG